MAWNYSHYRIYSFIAYLSQKYTGFFFLEKWNKISLAVNRLSAIDILVALGGLIVGLVIGALLTYPLSFLFSKITTLSTVSDFGLWHYWFGIGNNSQRRYYYDFYRNPENETFTGAKQYS
jgi:uncharacterized protein YacL